MGWLAGRHRWQASSRRYSGQAVGDWLAVRPSSRAGSLLQGLGEVSGGLVGWQAAFASRLAPTVGMGGVSWGLVGWQTAFASRLAPTVFNLRTTQAAKPPHSTG